MTSCPHLPPSLPPCFFFFSFKFDPRRSDAPGRRSALMTPFRLCCRQLEHLLGSGAPRPPLTPRALHHICFSFFIVLFFKKKKNFFLYLLLIPSHASPSSNHCFGHDVNLAPISRDLVTAGRLHVRSLFGFRKRKTAFPACKEQKSNVGKKKKPIQSYFSVGDFSFLSFLFFPVSYGV